jgi:branched-chain amino acid transport system permease protein
VAARWAFRAQGIRVTLAGQSQLLSRHRVLWPEVLFWFVAIAVYLLFPQYLAIAATVLVVALFAVSYDLAIGFGGILTLGHGLYFGIGAYAAAWLALAGWREAVSGAVASGAFAMLVAAALGPFLLRLTGLPLIMVTLGASAIAYEAGNKATWLTGGDDGLTGFSMSPLLGAFRWSVFGDTKYFYSLGWLFVLFYLVKRVVASPFGVALQGIRENKLRMSLIGTPTLRYLVVAYGLSAGVAGVAGAVSAQTNAFVGLGVLSLDTTIDGLVVVVLGGIGTLYGALVGAPVYILVKHFAQQWNPFYWMFVVGALLIAVVRFGHGGLLGTVQGGLARFLRR